MNEEARAINLSRLRQRDQRATLFALFTAVVMIAQQVAGKATRDALFLSNFDVTVLPRVVIVSALFSVIAVLVTSRLLAFRSPARLVPAAFLLSALLFAAEWWGFAYAPRVVVLIVYFHMGAFGAVLVSGFWSVINERFDPHTAKRSVARIAAAATLGGVIGGFLAGRVSALTDLRTMLLVLCLLHIACVLGVRGIGSLHGLGAVEAPAPVRSGLQILSGNRYLQRMGLLMLLAAVVSALLDYALKAEASFRMPGAEALVTFFATFYAAVGVVTFLVQLSIGPPVLSRFGIVGAIAVLPAVMAVGGVLAAAANFFWAFVCLRAAESIFFNSLHRSGFELLYTPLSPVEKRPTKSIVDVGGSRLGDMLGGALLLGILFLLPNVPASVVVFSAAAISVLSLFVVVALYRGYVSRLATNLRAGWLTLDAEAIADATSRRVFAETTAQAEREMLLARINELESAGVGDAAPARQPAEARLGLIADLTSGQPERMRRALVDSHLEAAMVPYVLPLLADDTIADQVRLELRWLAPRIVGQLTDALLDPDLPLAVRSRLPGVMEVVHNRRVIDGLMLGLDDPEFSVRFSCARALSRMTERSPDLFIAEETVFETARRELEVEEDRWLRQTHVAAVVEDRQGLPDGALLPSMQHVVTVLGLALDREALPLAVQGVMNEDPAVRGTAMEYLENVLPVEIRQRLWERLGITQSVPRSHRSRNELLDMLRQFSREQRNGPRTR